MVPDAVTLVDSKPIALWLGDNDEEMEFCRRQLRAECHLIDLQTDWLRAANWRSLRPYIAFVGASARLSDYRTQIDLIRHQWPTCPVQLILGSWYRGHRRTNPIDEILDTAYWYQVWDQILPRFRDQRLHRKRSKATHRTERILAIPSSVGEASRSLLSLIIVDSPSRREVWQNVSKWLNLQPIFIRPEDCFPKGDFGLIVFDEQVDCDWSSEMQDARGSDNPSRRLLRLRSMCPAAIILKTDPQPEVDRWNRYVESGVDVVLSIPFSCWGIKSATRLGCN